MNRKKFIQKMGLATLVSPALISSCEEKDTPEIDPADDCKITGSDALGPFFVENSPNVVNINTQNLPGTPMMMEGVVYGGEGQSNPLQNAKIEIWHADDNGAYHPEGSGDISDYPPEEVTLRGFVLADGEGKYAFASIRPGLYGSRARHIHFKITAEGYRTLVTQSYFLGDERIEHDTLARTAESCRIVDYQSDTDGIFGVMDFNLEIL